MVTIIKKGTSKKDIKNKVEMVNSRLPKKSIKQYAGKLNIQIDPLKFQIEMRNEWD